MLVGMTTVRSPRVRAWKVLLKDGAVVTLFRVTATRTTCTDAKLLRTGRRSAYHLSCSIISWGEPSLLDGYVPWPQTLRDRCHAAGYRRGETLGGWLLSHRERVAVVADEQWWTYAEFDNEVGRAAIGFRIHGLRAGDRVVLYLPNVPKLLVVAFSLFRLGATPMLALPAHREHEIGYFCDHAGVVAYVGATGPTSFDPPQARPPSAGPGPATDPRGRRRPVRTGWRRIRALRRPCSRRRRPRASPRGARCRPSDPLQGKTLEETTPLGPVIVALDELPGGTRPELPIRTVVSGDKMQKANACELLLDPVTLVRYLSSILTLQPGDIIATGTPGGVGHARKPPRYLIDGDLLVTEIYGIGRCENRVVVA